MNGNFSLQLKRCCFPDSELFKQIRPVATNLGVFLAEVLQHCRISSVFKQWSQWFYSRKTGEATCYFTYKTICRWYDSYHNTTKISSDANHQLSNWRIFNYKQIKTFNCLLFIRAFLNISAVSNVPFSKVNVFHFLCSSVTATEYPKPVDKIFEEIVWRIFDTHFAYFSELRTEQKYNLIEQL